jgi:DNA-binding MarR family transcriptional regulator
MEKRYETFTVLIASINRSIRRLKTEAMAEYGLKSPHVSCLYYLFKRPGMTAAELGGLCEEDKAAISRSILYLEQNGYVTRAGAGTEEIRREGSKRYRSPLALTEEGRAIAERIAARVDEVLERISDGISEDERLNMYKTLLRLDRNLRALCEVYEEDPADEED